MRGNSKGRVSEKGMRGRERERHKRASPRKGRKKERRRERKRRMPSGGWRVESIPVCEKVG